MRRVHRYYNRYPHGSLEGYAANYAYRYVKRRVISIIVGIVILIICGVVLTGALAFVHFWFDLDSYGAEISHVKASHIHSTSAGRAAAASAAHTDGISAAHAAGTRGTAVKSTGAFADSSGISSADVSSMFVKKDIGDEIGTINATSRWQKFHVPVGEEYSKTANFRISVPGTGYLILEINTKGKSIMNNTVLISTDGFEGPEYMTPKNKRTYIGVSKGIYTISAQAFKSEYDMRLKFKKVKEGDFGTAKSNASVLKKYRSRKGILTVDKRQTHWYKIKHSNTRPIRVKASTRNSSGGHGGIQISLYQGSRLRGCDFTIRSKDTVKIKAPPYKDARYLDKGIYYIKVESNHGGNGCYSIKWK